MTTTVVESTVENVGTIVEGTLGELRLLDETTPSKEFSLDITDGTIGEEKVRYIGDYNIIGYAMVAVSMSTPPVDKKTGKVTEPTPERAIALAKAAGKWAAENGIAVMASGMREVDSYALNAAMEAKGKVVIMLPMGIQALFNRIKPENLKAIKNRIKEGRVLIISSKTKDDAAWDTLEAQRRNGFIATLADALFVPHVNGQWDSQKKKYTGGMVDLIERADAANIRTYIPAWRGGENLFMGMADRLLPVTRLEDEDEKENIFQSLNV